MENTGQESKAGKSRVQKDRSDSREKLDLINKRFMLLFDKGCKGDKKKQAEIKEQIKQSELKITDGKDSVTKIGKKLDISDHESD